MGHAHRGPIIVRETADLALSCSHRLLLDDGDVFPAGVRVSTFSLFVGD